jgi:hypothetical protein
MGTDKRTLAFFFISEIRVIRGYCWLLSAALGYPWLNKSQRSFTGKARRARRKMEAMAGKTVFLALFAAWRLMNGGYKAP